MKILVFAPHSAIWVHAFPEALVGEALAQQGHEIVYASCGRLFSRYCVAMSAYGLGFDASAEARNNICGQCIRNDSLIREKINFKGPVLSGLLTPSDFEEIEQIVAAANPDSFLEIERDGISLGRVALYQLMIRQKILDLKFTPDQWQEYLVELRHTLYAWRAMQHLIVAHRPDRVIVYNGLYSVNRAACLAAEARGIPAYFLHAGGNLSSRLQTLMIGRGNTFSYYPKLLASWPLFSKVPCTARMLSAVTDHYLALFGARSVFVYSKKKSTDIFDVRKYFKIQRSQKILVATLGSYDEEVAAELVGARTHSKPLLFETQIDWAKALLEFSKSRPDIFLIVRVHPREFSNNRERVTSQHAMLLRDALSNLPENVAVNWPSDELSLYDLADEVDVFLNSWSSTGKEMALLGIPVVLYSDELPFYPGELNYFGDTRDTYFAEIERALADGWSAKTVRQSYRWAAYEFIRSTIDISDSYSQLEWGRRSIMQRVLDRVRRGLDRDFRQRRDLRRRSARLMTATQIANLFEAKADTVIEQMAPENVECGSLTDEAIALKKELGRIGEALFPTPDAQRRSRLFAKLSNPSLPM